LSRTDLRRDPPAAALFSLIALPAGLALLVLTPPFQVPDESAHFFRAFQLAEGTIRAVSDGRFPGGVLPASLVETAESFPPAMAAEDPGVLAGRIRRGLADPLEPDRRRFVPFATAAYGPIPYLPAALTLAAGKASAWSPLALLYAGRLATLIAAVLLHGLALKVAPAFRWSLALLALTPMAGFLRSGLSADGVTNGLAFLFFALVLRLAPDGGESRRPAFAAGVVAVSVALAFCKLYVVLLPLLLLVPRRSPAVRRVAWSGLLFGGAAAAGWMALCHGLPLPPRLDVPVDTGAQLRSFGTEPGSFLAAAGRELFAGSPRHFRELLGQLGWLDVRIPAALLALVAGVLLVLALSESCEGLNLRRPWRIGILAVIAAGVLTTFAAMYVLHTPAGARGIEGIQGRYFIPFTPPALFLLVAVRRRISLSGRAAARLVLLAALLGLGGAAWALGTRYIAPSAPAPAAAARLLQCGVCPLFPRSPSSSTSS